MSVYWVTPPLCVYVGNPNWSFMVLKAAKQARAAASSPGRRQTSQDPVLLPVCLGHSRLLPVACRYALDFCFQRMSAVASGTREIWEKERGGGVHGTVKQLRGAAGLWETLTCSLLPGHSPVPNAGVHWAQIEQVLDPVALGPYPLDLCAQMTDISCFWKMESLSLYDSSVSPTVSCQDPLSLCPFQGEACM